MPEFPEVNVQIRYLRRLCLGWRIEAAWVRPPRHFKNLPKEGRAAIIEDFFSDNTLEDITQRGKVILMRTSKGPLVSHMMLKGRWSVADTPFVSNYPRHSEPPEPRTLTLKLTNTEGRHLELHDLDNLARATFYPGLTAFSEIPALSGLGPEVLTVEETETALSEPWTLERFAATAGRSRQAIKPFLLDQKKQCGLGNRYICDALYLARVDPRTPARELPPETLARLHGQCVGILRRAIETDLDYDTVSPIYKREHDPEGRPVTTEKIAGRDTSWVPELQAAKPS